MMHNRELFRYLIRSCAYLWNDIHLALLTNFVLESQWIDGVKILFTSIRQIFLAMNRFEQDKYLRFCERSVQMLNDPDLLSEFRYLMSFEPFNAAFIPIMLPAGAPPDDPYFNLAAQHLEESAYLTLQRHHGKTLDTVGNEGLRLKLSRLRAAYALVA